MKKKGVSRSTCGQITWRAGTTVDTPFLFNGRYGVMTDANGLYHMRARYYNAFIKRFVNADPTGLSAGLNFYAYADGNPISLVDPFGLWSWGETLSVAGHFALGVAVGAVITAAVIVAAPVVASAGAAALVAAGISAATATTVSTATVTVGLYAAGSYGAYRTVANTAQSVGTATVTGDWNPVAYNVGTIVGGTAVGVSGGGRALAENLMGGPSAAPNTWNPRAMLDYEIANAYKRSLGPPGLDYWATAPTPFSGGFTAGGIATGIGTSLPIGNAAK